MPSELKRSSPKEHADQFQRFAKLALPRKNKMMPSILVTIWTATRALLVKVGAERS
jgi:hypothetical protein